MTTAYDPGDKPRPSRYHLQGMANREELGVNIYESLRNWTVSERFRRDAAIARGEPVAYRPGDDWRETREEYVGQPDAPLAAKDHALSLSDDLEFEDVGVPDPQPDATAESNAICFLYAQQLMDVMHDVLGHDFEVLKHVIVENWSAQMLGEDEGFINRASASACGKGLIRAALRNLDRFYTKLDRLEQNGSRPQDVWPLIGTQNYPAVTRQEVAAGYLNQARGPVIKRN